MKTLIRNKYICFFIFVVLIYFLINIQKQKEHFKIVTIKAGFNNNYYNVRNDFENTEDAANIMAKIKHNIEILIEHLDKNHGHKDNVKNLKKRFDFNSVVEAKHEDGSTSFTINKGEEMHICLRDKDGNKKLHDLNTLMFVILHELAHVMSDTVGHNQEFRDNFKFILNMANDINVYHFTNYSQYPESYCGIKINSSPITF